MKKTKSGSKEAGDPPAQLSDARIKEPSDWRGQTLARIRMLIKQADPEVVEEVVHITRDGGRPLFSWGFAPLMGR